jgi:hypothetical protein
VPLKESAKRLIEDKIRQYSLEAEGFRIYEDRTPTHGYEPTREAAMAACAKSWRRV